MRGIRCSLTLRPVVFSRWLPLEASKAFSASAFVRKEKLLQSGWQPLSGRVKFERVKQLRSIDT